MPLKTTVVVVATIGQNPGYPKRKWVISFKVSPDVLQSILMYEGFGIDSSFARFTDRRNLCKGAVGLPT